VYKPMKRFVIRCEFCGKKTDCLAFDLEDSIERFKQRGWQVFMFAVPKKDGEEKPDIKKIACKSCSFKLNKLPKEQNDG